MTRAVTDILYRTDGTAWASAPVTFERTAGSFDDGSSWPPDEKQVTTDATGAYSVQLWPDAAGSIRSRYHVTYPNGDVFYVSIPDGTTPITMPEIRVAAAAPPVPPSALDAHVAASDPHAGYLLPAEADLRYAALVHSQAWSTITGTPTTLLGYGITDAFSQASADLRYAPIVHSHTFASLTSRPTTIGGYGITDAYTIAQVDGALSGKANAATTLGGYGITDAYTKTAADARYAPIAHTQAWSTITTTPTTLGGYGITDAVTLGTAQTIAGVKTFSAAPILPMTQGSVLFAGAAGVLAQNNAGLFWDDTNRRLGISTATPAAKLDVLLTAGQSIRLTGPTTNFTVTESSGTYALANSGTGSHVIMASATNYTFLPQSSIVVGASAALGGNAALQVRANFASNPGVLVRGLAFQTADLQQWQDSGSAILSRIDKNGYVITHKNAAPADADLGSSDLAFWFDSTNGAAKVMFKGKNAAGTVVTGQVALA